MADMTYNHYCPHQPTIADLQGLLLAAWELAQAAAKVASQPIAGQLQGVTVVLPEERFGAGNTGISHSGCHRSWFWYWRCCWRITRDGCRRTGAEGDCEENRRR